MMLCIFQGHIYAYNHSSKRFTSFDMLEAGVSIYSATDFDNVPHFGGDTGRTFKWDTTRSSDEPTDGAEEDFTSKIRSKFYVMPKEAIIRRTDMNLISIDAGAAIIEAVGLETTTTLKTITLLDSITYLANATSDLYAANGDLYDGGTAGIVETSRNRTRKHAFSLQLRSTSGRVGIDSATVQIAMVNG